MTVVPVHSKAQTIDRYNVIKGLSILFVISTHILYTFHGHDKPALLEWANYAIGFGVPLFMIMGGFFLAPKLELLATSEQWVRQLKRLCRRVILPYYLFLCILIAFRWHIGKPVSVIPLLLLIDANTHGLYFIIIYVYSCLYCLGALLLLNHFLGIGRELVLNKIIPLLSLLSFPLSKMLMMNFPESAVAQSTPFISFFAFGFPLFALHRKMSGLTSLQKRKGLGILCCVCLVYTGFLYASRKIYGHFPIISNNPPTVFWLCYSILLFLILNILLEEAVLLVAIGKLVLLHRFGEESLFLFFLHPYLVYPLPYLFNGLFSEVIHNNMFVIPWLISVYLIAYMSLRLYQSLPLRIRSVFSR